MASPPSPAPADWQASLALLTTDAQSMSVPRYQQWKAPLERCLALGLLVLGLPLIGALLLLVRCTSRGKALFRQRRMGWQGREFTMFKIRTMVDDAEAATGPIWSSAVDPRVTFIGRILRKCHLDELPQLFNVLRGEMALIGPRPERPEIAAKLVHHIPGYGRRLAVLPGITGLAQINLPPDSDLESVREKLVLDLRYIEQGGPWLDMRMLVCSLLRLIGVPGDWAMRLLWLRCECVVPPAWRHFGNAADATEFAVVDPPATLAGEPTPPDTHRALSTALHLEPQADSAAALRAVP